MGSTPTSSTIWYADGILDSLIETGQYTVFLFRFVSAQSNQPKLIHGIGTGVHFISKQKIFFYLNGSPLAEFLMYSARIVVINIFDDIGLHVFYF